MLLIVEVFFLSFFKALTKIFIIVLKTLAVFGGEAGSVHRIVIPNVFFQFVSRVGGSVRSHGFGSNSKLIVFLRR